MNRYKKDPLILAIELKIKALKSNAHPNIVKNIENKISNEAKMAISQFLKSDSQFPLYSNIVNKTKF